MKVTRLGVFHSISAIVLAGFSFAAAARAQQTGSAGDPPPSPLQDTPTTAPEAPVADKLLTNFVESGSSYEGLSNNYGQWNGGYLRGVVTNGNNTWNAEVNGQREFGDAGVYGAAGDTYTFNSDWYGAVTVGSSVGGFFWPRFRVDSFLNRKWAARRQFITTLGVGYDAAKDVHRDHTTFLGTTYYFDRPWIIEEGVHFNVSNPGRAFSASGFLAVTEGRNKQHYITANIGFGQEAYQIVGPDTVLTRFPSQTASATWRQWFGKNWGFNFVTDFYHSPFYHRGGGSFGFFRDF
jgi:YaiO family outer membrane protein